MQADARTQPPLTDKFRDAFEMAYQLHRLQLRKSTDVPYIAHLMSVSAIVLEFGGSETEAIAALLHDAVEDQGGQPVLIDIEHRFGSAVANIVSGCSDSSDSPKPPWKLRKQRYLQHLHKADDSILLVSGADKLHNLRDILLTFRQEGEKTWERFTGKREGTLWYYGELVDIFLLRGKPALAAELQRTYALLCALVESDLDNFSVTKTG